ncbi:MAG: hypothetical protein FJX68_01075 [Alphaproteobacteria bacterium]|nr:hypothetical protein [Alphaproteobacteria bacterium]
MTKDAALFDAQDWLTDAERLGLDLAWRDGKVSLDIGAASWRTWLLYTTELEQHEDAVARALRQRMQH